MSGTLFDIESCEVFVNGTLLPKEEWHIVEESTIIAIEPELPNGTVVEIRWVIK